VKLAVLAVGHRMPAWVTAAFEEYAKRMPREMPLQLKELKPAQRSNAAGDTGRWLQTEAERIAAAMPAGAMRVVLDEHGRSFPTRTLAEHLTRWRSDGRDIAFIIGGADGLADSVKARADLLWSLSPLTLPHGLVRVVLAEQLYRAASLLAGHPYHRD
jgi:23S rRNA (pseudouridine1915-N3)-methyltransferase